MLADLAFIVIITIVCCRTYMTDDNAISGHKLGCNISCVIVVDTLLIVAKANHIHSWGQLHWN